jgi:transcriptional regulator with XRE-family HTH domain
MKDMLNLRVQKVAANIRKIREYRNYTQEYLAAKLKISQNAYSKIELGYTKITVDRLFRIADILEVDPIDILNKENAGELRLVGGNTI